VPVKTSPKDSSGAYVSVDELLQLRHLAKDMTLEANKRSTAIVDGESRTSIRGRGMEFAEVRPYQVGDDIRNIDWRVTARTQKPYTKLFQEEKERPVYILVDQRSPMFFGSEKQFKSVLATKVAAVIAWAALNNNDRIGAMVFSDNEQTDSRARRGKHAVLAMLHQLFSFNQQLRSPAASNISNTLVDMLNDLRRVAKPGSAVYIISDFHDFNDACKEPLSVLARHTDVSVFHVYDMLERQLPIAHALSISDGVEKLKIAGQPDNFQHAFTQLFDKTRDAVATAAMHAGVSFASLSTGKDLSNLVRDVFASRKSKRGGRS